MANKTCFTCIYSFGAIEHLKDHSTLICWPSGNQEREQLAYKLCDEYFQEGASEMSLSDYEVLRDKFEEETCSALSFPCCVCKHRYGLCTEQPCSHCDHNVNAVSYNEE